MLKVLSLIKPVQLHSMARHQINRTFLSNAYYCNEVWSNRSASMHLEKINLDDLYYELDQRYQKNGAISAVDVDFYANKVQDKLHAEELLDLVHKLRLSAETTNTLNSTSHAVIRYLLEHNMTSELLNVLDDRLNYGVFVDFYTANILMDKFYKEKDFVAGCRVAAQLMLQETFKHPLNKALALLHCYNFLCKPDGWPEGKVHEEPIEEVKVRVKFLRNPYDDGHFDLRKSFQIVGKILSEFTRESYSVDDLDKSFHVLGLALCEKNIPMTKMGNLFLEVLNLLPEENTLRQNFQPLRKQPADIRKILEERVVQAEKQIAEEDIAQQCNTYNQWVTERKLALNDQMERVNIAERIANIKKIQDELNTKQEKLWFFENQEKIALSIENKRIYYPKRWFGKKKKPRKVDEGYVPPEL